MDDEYTKWLENNEEESIKKFIEERNLSDELDSFLWEQFMNWRSGANDYIWECNDE